jgi:phage/plasmid-associated DNA primase
MTNDLNSEIGNVTHIDDLRKNSVNQTDDTPNSKTIKLFREQITAQQNFDGVCVQIEPSGFCDFGDDGKPKPASQSMMSDELAKMLEGVIGVDEHGTFYIYCFSWKLLTTHEVETAVIHLIRLGTNAAGGFSAAKATGVIKLLSVHPLLIINPAPRGCIVFQNGAGLNTKTGESYTPTPECAPMSQLPYEWDGNTSSTKDDFPTIDWFLRFSIGDDETVELMYCFMAALIKQLSLQYILVLKGRGGTGKSAITRLLTNLVGDQNAFSTDLHGLEHKHTIGYLFRKMLLVLPDIGRQHGNKPHSPLKRVSGGDPMVRDIKNGAIHNFIFEGLTVITCNEDGIGGRPDSGLARRILMVPVDRVAGDEQRKAHPNLEEDMESQIPKLIPYLVAMDDSHIRNTLRNCTEVMSAARDAELQGDNVLVEFIKEFTEQGTVDDFLEIGTKEVVEGMPGGIQYDSAKKISTPLVFKNADTNLYPAYLTYCYSQGVKTPLNANVFTSELVKAANLMGYTVEKKYHSNTRRAIVKGLKRRKYHEACNAEAGTGKQRPF